MLREFCSWLAKRLPSFTIPDAEGNPYLTRYYLFGKDRAFGNIYLHHFHKSDSDADKDGSLFLHNHPWPFSFSLILLGGYKEERMILEHAGWAIAEYECRPGSFNFISHDDFHRVDLLEKDGWSLFFTGWRSKKRSWGFLNRHTKKYTDFTEFSKAIA